MSPNERVSWYRPARSAVLAERERIQTDWLTSRPDELRSPQLSERSPMPWERQRDALIDPDFGVGIPIVEGATSAKEYAIGLLKLAAEIEHALMVQYLYAADSIDPENDDRELATKVRKVAQEEMGHLGTVQNLLLLIGGPSAFYMQRDLIRRNSPSNPIPFVLEPITRLSLAKYVAAEMPEPVPDGVEEKVADLVKLVTADLGFEPRRVGAIYAMIRWVILPEAEAVAWMNLKAIAPDAPLPKDPHLKDTDFQDPAILADYELFGADWGDDTGHFLLEKARDRAGALDALKLITEQGEGFDSQNETHFKEFLGLIDAYDAEAFGRPIAISPTLHVGQGGEKPTQITAPYTSKWVEVQSNQYQLLVVGLLHSMGMPNSGATLSSRSELALLSIEAMRKVFAPLAKFLTGLPVGAPDSSAAGPSYDLDPSIVATADAAEYVFRQRAILARLETLYGDIKESPEFDPSSTVDLLKGLARQDRKRREFLDMLEPPPSV